MTTRARFPLSLALLAVLGLMALGSTASAASPVAKDGRIHACYKAKGKGKGTLRLVRNGKARCPRRWKKVSWQANGASVGGQPGPAGETGAAGSPGDRGLTGTAGNVSVQQLENKVNELLTKVQSLESILNGITNTDLKNAIALVPLVGSLCDQTENLTGQATALGGTLGSFNTVLDTLLVGFSPVTVPAALSPFSCPSP